MQILYRYHDYTEVEIHFVVVNSEEAFDKEGEQLHGIF
jgi:hypothetical protein